MNYDVFISCKSEDYIYAEQIYDFLTQNGVNTFLASKELRNLADSEYRRAISNAMKSTYHMIVFASDASYIDSPWVYYEWDMFVNAKLKGFKQGQMFTILKDIVVENINMDLWKYESFDYEEYKNKILSYVETPRYLKYKEEERRKEQLAEEENNRRKQKELKDLSTSIKLSISSLNNSEEKIEIEREQLVLKINSIDDKEVRDELLDVLDKSGPLHVKNSLLENVIAEKEDIISELKKCVEEYDAKLQTEVLENQELRTNLSAALKNCKDYDIGQVKVLKKRCKLLHIIYSLVIGVLLIPLTYFAYQFLGYLSYMENKATTVVNDPNRDIKNHKGTTSTTIKLPSIFGAPIEFRPSESAKDIHY